MTYFTTLWTSTGYTGAPGYTKLKFFAPAGSLPSVSEVNAAAANGRALIAGWSTGIPTGVSYAFTNPAQVYDDAGVLQGEVSATVIPTAVAGTGGNNFPGGCGGVIYWNTTAFNGGHKVRGRTFIVPLGTAVFANDGTLATALVSAAQTAVNTYVASSPTPCVNSRQLGQSDRSNATFNISSGTVKDRTAFLRTRRS